MLMLCIGLGSCSKDDYVSRIHELLIKRELVFEADAEAGDLTSTTTFRNEDLSNYQANSDADWCSVVFDAKASTMTVTVKENNSFEERKATVTVLDTKDKSASRTFTVTQKQNDVIRVADESNTYKVGTDGGRVVINLESNVSYAVQIQNADWITIPTNTGTRGLQKSQVVLDVARNTTESARSAQVYIVDETSGARTFVTISQEFEAYMKIVATDMVTYLDAKTYQVALDERGGDFSIQVETNVSFDSYTVDEDTWVRKKGNREVINDNTVSQKISVAAFTEKAESRTSTVSIQNKSFDLEYIINIVQTRNIFIQETSIKMLSGSSQKLTLHNGNNEAVLWQSSDETVATVDDEGKVTGVSAGAAIITVSSSDGMHTDNVSVTVETPTDLKDKISNQWQPLFTPVDDLSVLSHLQNTITNNSEYDLMLTCATLYCDDVVMSKVDYNASNGELLIGKTMTFEIDIPIERSNDSIVRDTTIMDDGTKVIVETKVPGKAKENTHKYVLVWEYTYSNQAFTYRCEYPEKSEEEESALTRKKMVRRTRRR